MNYMKNQSLSLQRVVLDNYDEITNMNDTQRSEINSMVTRIISRWATEYNIYFKRYSSDQFVAYLNQKS